MLQTDGTAGTLRLRLETGWQAVTASAVNRALNVPACAGCYCSDLKAATVLALAVSDAQVIEECAIRNGLAAPNPSERCFGRAPPVALTKTSVKGIAVAAS